MASYYWIKLYHEILDDPKMGRLPDRLWRRTIEMFLFAGREGGCGELPSVADMAWTLRTTPAELQEDINELERIGIIRQDDGADPFVVHFEERQAPIPPAERKRRQRERERHEQYTGDSQDSHEPVTFRTTELELDIEKRERERETPAPTPAPDCLHPAIKAYEHETGIMLTRKAQLDAILETVDTSENALGLWDLTIKAWGTAGYRYENVSGMLDWYVKGEALRQQKNTPQRGPPGTIPAVQEPVIIPSAVFNALPGVD
jgi:hypothetical protein